MKCCPSAVTIIFERRISQAIDCHLERNELIDDSQHGFRRGRSCETNLLMLMEYHAQRAEDGDDEDDVYFDLRAFFDSIPHQRCLASLNAHGVLEKGKVYRWVRAWLGAGGELQEQGVRRQEEEEEEEQGKSREEAGQGSRRLRVEQGEGGQENEEGARSLQEEIPPAPLQLLRRRQKVLLNGQASVWHDVTASIIQGSCLGPTLAKCFSNSSHQGRNLLPADKPLLSKFADDEKRCRIVKNAEQGKRMQDDINNMVDWTFKMGVELNEEKVHILHIGRNNPKIGYTLGEEGPNIVSVEQEKDLGVIISSDLKSDKMVAKQCQRGHLKLTQFNNTFTYRGKTWLKLYKTYIKPSMMYACEAWRPTTKEGIEKLESVQRRALKMAGELEERKDYRAACRKAGLNTVEEELDEADLIRTFRIINGDD